MEDICTVCRLPSNICICTEGERTELSATLSYEERRYSKRVTIIDGLPQDECDLEALISDLKSACACGGTIRDGDTIELQGAHKNVLLELLPEYNISVSE